jgi:hypothetical protein
MQRSFNHADSFKWLIGNWTSRNWDGSRHRNSTEFGNAPASRVRDFGDQTVSVTAIENAGYLGALPARIGDVFEVWRVLELVSDVGIGKSTNHVLAVEQSTEDLSFITRERIECFCASFWSHFLTGRDAIQSANRIGGIVDIARAAR